MKDAGAADRYQDLISPTGQRNLVTTSEFNVSIDRPELEFALPDRSEPPDQSQDETEHKSDTPQQQSISGVDPNIKTSKTPSVSELCGALFAAAGENGLPVPFFANLLWQESGLRLDIVSRAGARGIAQFMPEVAAEVGLRDPFDPRQAIPASARLLHDLREQFRNLGFTAAAYNAGPHRVTEWLDHGRALPDETKNYVKNITGRSAEAWRKSPVADSELTFVQVLPCRPLPAFADLEKTQNRLAHTQPRPLPPAEDMGEKIAQIAVAAKKVAQKVFKTIAAGIASKADKKAVALHRTITEAKIAASKAGEKIARNLHDAKHEVQRTQHGSREKRKVALR